MALNKVIQENPVYVHLILLRGGLKHCIMPHKQLVLPVNNDSRNRRDDHGHCLSRFDTSSAYLI
jgi:hypothetical protein